MSQPGRQWGKAEVWNQNFIQYFVKCIKQLFQTATCGKQRVAKLVVNRFRLAHGAQR